MSNTEVSPSGNPGARPLPPSPQIKPERKPQPDQPKSESGADQTELGHQPVKLKARPAPPRPKRIRVRIAPAESLHQKSPEEMTRQARIPNRNLPFLRATPALAAPNGFPETNVEADDPGKVMLLKQMKLLDEAMSSFLIRATQNNSLEAARMLTGMAVVTANQTGKHALTLEACQHLRQKSKAASLKQQLAQQPNDAPGHGTCTSAKQAGSDYDTRQGSKPLPERIDDANNSDSQPQAGSCGETEPPAAERT